MERSLVALVVASGIGVASSAQAGAKRGYVFIDPRGVGADYIAPAPTAVSHIIYLNRCVGGCTITPGSDGRQSQSAIVSGTRHMSEFAGSDAQWQQIMACVKDTYSPFNVTITDQRPASGDYHTAIVAGTSAEAGQSSGAIGVSPFSCGYINDAISFTFANTPLSGTAHEYSDILDACWTISQETAHSWGLDHKYDHLDPMTYIYDNPEIQKRYQNQAGSCGTSGPMTCQCTYAGTGNSAMNSYALILATFGAGTPDTTPPTVSITSPSNNASIMPGFEITVQAADDVAISKVELAIDGTSIDTDTSAPFTFTAPATLSQGSHHVEATATDSSNNTAMAAIDVIYGQACTTNGCSDPTQVCDDGHCVPGPTTMGGLGSPCAVNTDCASGSCGDDGAGNKYCVTSCDPTNNMCPSGFGCISTGAATGVCWPGADNGGGNGCNTGGNGGAILAGLGFAALLARRRKRR